VSQRTNENNKSYEYTLNKFYNSREQDDSDSILQAEMTATVDIEKEEVQVQPYQMSDEATQNYHEEVST